MLAALVLATVLVRPFDFFANGPYDPAVPTPDSILRYGPGERHSTFRDLERVVTAIAAAAKDRVRLFEYGATPEGRPLRVLVVSSPENIRRLEDIRRQHDLLAHGKGDPVGTVPIVWINECIHGDETASCEAGMWTLYNLAASRGTLSKALDREVVILNPIYNPDGHERYVVYYNSVATGSPEAGSYEHRAPGVMLGRLNHYRFDMNRDRVAFSQDETRQEFAEMLRWNPQVYIDQHGQVGSYFFPPEPMSINENVDRARNSKWTQLFGRATGRAFDDLGLGFYTRNEFDLFYPGYIDSSNTLTGAIGMTHETDGGRVLAEQRPNGSTVTLQQGMFKHFTSALAVVRTAAEHSGELLADYATFKRRTCDGTSAGKFKRVVIEGDPRALARLSAQLRFAGIRSEIASQPFDQPEAHDYWTPSSGAKHFPAGALVVDMAQSQGALAKALLEPTGTFEDEFVKAQVAKRKAVPSGETYPGPEDPEFYDLTAWSLPFAHELRAWWCETAPPVTTSTDSARSSHASPLAADSTVGPSVRAATASTVGYAIPYTDDEDALAVFGALLADVRAEVSTKPMTLAGRTFAAGTFFFMAGRNEPGYQEKLAGLAASHGSELVPLKTSFPDSDRFSPGSSFAIQLRKPRIALVMGSTGNLSQCGPIWYLLERVWKLPFTPIGADALTDGDLSKYTCIVLPDGVQAPSTGRFHDWIGAGNVAVAFQVDRSMVGTGKYVELTEVPGDIAPLPGSLFRAQMDPRSFLSFGYPALTEGAKIDLAVPVRGDHFWQIKREGGSVVSLAGDDKHPLLLSGWEWPEDTETHLRNTTYVQDVPVGQGHLILYTQDPTDRAMWPGLYKTLLNAMLVGSGF
jgi:hypothetical protein